MQLVASLVESGCTWSAQVQVICSMVLFTVLTIALKIRYQFQEIFCMPGPPRPGFSSFIFDVVEFCFVPTSIVFYIVEKFH